MNKINPNSVTNIAEAPKTILSDSSACLDLGFYQGVVWERRRYEIAKDAMQGFISCKYDWDAKYTAKEAVKYADALINELKQK